MTNGPDVSVIVRSMGRASLQQTLDSLAAQHGVALEVVVVVACGPGHPPLPAHAGEHPVRAVGGERRLPRGAACNVGLDAARGAWISFLDDDDTFDQGHLASLLGDVRSRQARMVYSLADAAFSDGHHETFGQPFSLSELYERSYVHLSTALFDAQLLRKGCRFDESLDMHDDWDFVLQLAHHVVPAFVPRQSFRWNADVGSSGAGGGRNTDDARFAAARDCVYAKWQVQRDTLVERVRQVLERGVAFLQAGDAASAERLLQAALQEIPNDPHVLNLLGLLLRRTGRLDDALAAQTLAVAVRPGDPALVFNLALVAMARGEPARAQACCGRALALEPRYAPAQRLLASLKTSGQPGVTAHPAQASS